MTNLTTTEPMDIFDLADFRLMRIQKLEADNKELLEALTIIMGMCGEDDAHIHSLAHAAIAEAGGQTLGTKGI